MNRFLGLLGFLFFIENSHSATLIDYWKLNETSGTIAADTTGTNPGSVLGTATWQPAKKFGGLTLDGTTSVSVPHTSPLSVIGSGSFSITAWVKDDRPSGVNTWSTIFSKGNHRAGYCTPGISGGTPGVLMGRYSSTQSKFVFAMMDGLGNCFKIDSGTYAYTNPGSSNYHFVAMTINRTTGVMSAYVNDTLIGTTSISGMGTLNLDAYPLLFGFGNQNWLGVLDEIKLYTGVLTLTQIRNTFYADNAKTGNTPPSIQVTSPLAATTMTRDQTLTLSATASDSNGTISMVKFLANGTSIGEDQSSPYSFDWRKMAAGTYSVVLQAIDEQGATASSAPVTVNVSAINFSNAINPTGNPLGGGIGYNRPVLPSNATHVVSTAADLIAKLGTATSGQTIYISDTAVIDLSGLITNTANNGITIPAGVTLASGRGTNGSEGALILSNDRFTESNLVAVFKTGGPGVRITGLRFQGPFGEVGDESYTAIGVSNAIRSMTPGLEVDNCEFYNWDKWAIWLYIYDGSLIHHNFFHDNLRNGYGYSVWLGGSSSELNANAIIEGNLFSRCRHCIASSGHLNNWEARYNIFFDQNLYFNIDRHDQGTTGYGGKNTSLHHNLFMDVDNSSFNIAAPAPTSGGVLSLFSNWFYKLAHSFDDFPKASDMANYPAGQIQVSDLRFGFDSSFLPIASFTASTLNGVAPLKVNFNATASSDRDGNSIRNHRWSMGEGDNTSGTLKTGVTTSHIFTQPGKYTVKLMVQNTKGVPAFATKDILVKPSATGKWLSLWVLDSYIGNLSNFYKKQILVNNQVVWEDDVAGDEKWQHLVLNVTSQIGTATTARVAVRLASINATTTPMDDLVNLPELRVWIDDLYLFGGTVTNTGFENNSLTGWAFLTQGASWGTQVTTESARSGTYSVVLRQGIFQTRNANEWVEIFQNVPITP